MHTKKWFENRMGKRIYRITKTSCNCEHCKNVYDGGLIIWNLQHAHYLYICQLELNLNYSDKERK